MRDRSAYEQRRERQPDAWSSRPLASAAPPNAAPTK